MNISQKLLLLLCLSTVARMELFDFNMENYDKICDPLVITHPEDYEAT